MACSSRNRNFGFWYKDFVVHWGFFVDVCLGQGKLPSFYEMLWKIHMVVAKKTIFLDKFCAFTLKDNNFDFVTVMFWNGLLGKE